MASRTETLPHRQVTRHVMTLHADEAYLSKVNRLISLLPNFQATV